MVDRGAVWAELPDLARGDFLAVMGFVYYRRYPNDPDADPQGPHRPGVCGIADMDFEDPGNSDDSYARPGDSKKGGIGGTTVEDEDDGLQLNNSDFNTRGRDDLIQRALEHYPRQQLLSALTQGDTALHYACQREVEKDDEGVMKEEEEEQEEEKKDGGLEEVPVSPAAQPVVGFLRSTSSAKICCDHLVALRLLDTGSSENADKDLVAGEKMNTVNTSLGTADANVNTDTDLGTPTGTESDTETNTNAQSQWMEDPSARLAFLGSLMCMGCHAPLGRIPCLRQQDLDP
ncbi:hypothetical protein GGR56DRAFT_678205 [Xylariaceae sp. FL0804]|nr:hypothetical protein GGR56DRAFT_678205 [Xylariaceae sp. FL0804]